MNSNVAASGAAMRKVFLITGFNNWGKTRIISDIFDVGAFRHDRLHMLPSTGYDFLVLPKSNDDLGLRLYCEEYYERMENLRNLGIKPDYIASAFCPTREPERRVLRGPKNSNSINIIRELYGKDEVHMLLLEYKWCGHAQLRTNEIKAFYSGERNVKVHSIGSTTYANRLITALNTINAQLP